MALLLGVHSTLMIGRLLPTRDEELEDEDVVIE
jgi:hypothetical protein